MGKYTETKGLYTFGVISGVELKKFDGVVGKTVHIDPVLQYDDDPVKRECIIVIVCTQLHKDKVVVGETHLSCLMRTARTGLVKVNSSTSLSLGSRDSRASSQISTEDEQ